MKPHPRSQLAGFAAALLAALVLIAALGYGLSIWLDLLALPALGQPGEP